MFQKLVAMLQEPTSSFLRWFSSLNHKFQSTPPLIAHKRLWSVETNITWVKTLRTMKSLPSPGWPCWRSWTKPKRHSNLLIFDEVCKMSSTIKYKSLIENDMSAINLKCQDWNIAGIDKCAGGQILTNTDCPVYLRTRDSCHKRSWSWNCAA